MTKGNTAYRFAVGLALAPALIIVWMALGVGILGRPGDLADSMYFGVLAIGLVGAMIARFRPHGMAIALFATALAQALVAVVVLVTGMQQGPSAGTILALHALFVALFLESAWLFRSARAWTSPNPSEPPPSCTCTRPGSISAPSTLDPEHDDHTRGS